MKRVCLVMIVKNEAAIIDRCLWSAVPFVDAWCIMDTGSTDTTLDRLRTFRHDRPGRIAVGEFHNFAQARNEALDEARRMGGWDYALLLDADMELTGTIDKASLSAPAYRLKQINGSLEYWNTRLLRRDVPAVYKGVTHEYLSVPDLPFPPMLDTCVIQDRNDGCSKGDKTERDIRLLMQGLTDEPTNERYMFYLASSYRDASRHAEAIHWYKRRIDAGGWDEEVWAAYYGIARCYFAMANEAELVRWCFEAYNFRPSRAEPLGLLARWYREHGKSDAAMAVAEMMRKIPMPSDILFVEPGVYEEGADYEASIAGFYSRVPVRREAAYFACAKLTTSRDPVIRSEARRNFVHYVKSAEELFGSKSQRIELEADDGYSPMNPSVLMVKGRRLCLVRTVNYKIAEGQYPTNDGSGVIRTRNWLYNMDEEWRLQSGVRIVDRSCIVHNDFPVRGFEDCRLYGDESPWVMASATVRDVGDGRCEMAIVPINLLTGSVHEFRLVRDYEHAKTQKNWMPVIGKPGSFLYLCDPTIVVAWENDRTTETHCHKPERCLADWRGGSQLIPYDDGYLCIVHEVVWAPQRHYFHRFVKFDCDFKIEGFTEPFYFEHKGVEFCAGLTRDGDRLVASYGVNDASAHLAFFDWRHVDAMLQLFG